MFWLKFQLAGKVLLNNDKVSFDFCHSKTCLIPGKRLNINTIYININMRWFLAYEVDNRSLYKLPKVETLSFRTYRMSSAELKYIRVFALQSTDQHRKRELVTSGIKKLTSNLACRTVHVSNQFSCVLRQTRYTLYLNIFFYLKIHIFMLFRSNY